ncbi:hypothetical protein [Luteimonas sp. A482]
MATIPEPDLDDPKEVYAFAGLALYQANLLESSLINLTTVLQLEQVSAITRKVFDSVYEGLESKTLGQLLRAARGLTELPANIDSVLASALAKRNFLAHHFFRHHAGTIIHDLGRTEMIEELRGMIALFEEADALVTPVYLALWSKFGVDESAMARELSAMEAEVQAKYSGL